MTIDSVNSAVSQVSAELATHGFLTSLLEDVGVYLVPTLPLGLDVEGAYIPATGNILIARWRFGFLSDLPRLTLRHILRHEFGHALTYKHGQKFNRSGFGWCFSEDHQCGHCDDCRITEYAKTDSMEDFCETFAVFLRTGGRKPRRRCKVLREKWDYIRELGKRLRSL